MQYGSLQNLMMGGARSAVEPEVGMGATMLLWSDRRAATIVEVTRFKTGARAGQVKAVKVQADRATRVDSNGMSESQTYEYEPDPDGPVFEYRATKAGTFKDDAGGGLRIGTRDHYYDFSF